MTNAARETPRPALRLALRVYVEAASGNTALLAFLSVVDPLLLLGLSLTTGILVGAAPSALEGGAASAAAARMLWALVASSVILLVHGAVRAVLPTVTLMQVSRVSFRTRQRAVDAALAPRGVQHLEDPGFLDELEMGLGREWSVGQTVYSVAGLLSSSVHLLGASVILARFRWWAPVAVLACLAVQLRWADRGASSVFRSGVENSTPDRRRAHYYRDLAVEPAAAKELRVFGLPEWVGGRFLRHWTDGLAPVWHERRRTRFLTVVPLAVTVGTSAVIFLELARAAAGGDIGLTELAIYAQQAVALFGLASMFFDQNFLLGLGLRAAAHLFALPQRAAPAQLRGTAPPPPDAPAHMIRFENVAFAYPQTSTSVFDGLTLDIRAGESLAVVGQNGAGKTTLVKLLCRLYDPGRGRITVDGIDLVDLDPDKWRERLAVIFQDFVKYELSLRDNVALGRDAQLGSPDELSDALALAGGHDLLAQLPHVWDTVLSRAYPDGVDLSGGQWQKIALARALAAARTGGVLILDEPTANLDVRAEAALFDRFLDITKGTAASGTQLTTVLISHRFSTVRRADRIVVLEGGAVVEDGAHEELMQQAGLYARMFSLQAQRFLDDASTGEPAGA